jgi:phenylpropionate dioxygenase-like ring-hydroxylating dioxygenase large terminal subunit
MTDIIFKTDHGPRLPQAIPFGWYFVGYSDELAIGEVKPLEYFDRDLVMFRNESGEVGVLDAYCPHMGAHLGYGGSVDGDSLRCPFHAWGISPDAIVTDVPYAKRIPPKVADKQCMHKYPSVEKNKVIWAWYHPENKPPFFEVMEHEEIGHPDWIELKKFD